jgi:hypothetical protein
LPQFWKQSGLKPAIVRGFAREKRGLATILAVWFNCFSSGNGRNLASISQNLAALIRDLQRKARRARLEISRMTQEIKTQRRWLRSVIVASAEPLPTLPWMRGQRRKPTALATSVAENASKEPRVSLFIRSQAIAAR